MRRSGDLGEFPIGKTLTSIGYQLLGHEPVRCSKDVDMVHVEVKLGFRGGPMVVLRWLMEGFSESLAIGERRPGEPTPNSYEHDATPRWPLHVGAKLSGISWAMHSSPGGTTPWACRLSFEGGVALVVALGECMNPGELTYIPDNLLVIGAPKVAQDYKPPAAHHSAWGPQL